MPRGNFVDYVKIHVASGNGGAGSSSLRREMNVPKGGPDGGDGGRGGHVIVRADDNLWTLFHLKFRQHVRAGHGGNGGKQRSTGADGEDVYIDVPVGTVVRDTETDKILFELTEDGEEHILLEGGKGGLGNYHFKSSVRQTPRFAQPGMEGEKTQLTFEMKILADVGLVGFPNAGKSTLLSTITSAKPKIADYEFTTLKPSLGIVEYRNFQTFVMADIPGIIEGAAEGRGLGHYFLRHIERNSTLLFLIPADAMDLIGQYRTLLSELERYNPELLDKSKIITISKSDLLDEELKTEIRAKFKKELPEINILFFSSITNEGITELKDEIWKHISEDLVHPSDN